MISARNISPYASFLKEGINTGCVHSVFHKSLNLSFRSKLVHVGGDFDELSCIGLSLAISKDELRSFCPHLRAGTFVRVREGHLCIYADQGPLEIDLAPAVRMDCSLLGGFYFSYREALWARDLMRDQLGLSFDELLTRGGFSRRSQAGSERLEALERKRLEQLAHAEPADEQSLYQHFLGRGIGLTPSGDDLLLGYASVLTTAGFTSSFEHIKALAAQFAQRTSPVSAAYLAAFTEGWINPVYKAFFEAIHTADTRSAKSCVDRILTIGQSSGVDALLGMYLGFERICRQMSERRLRA